MHDRRDGPLDEAPVTINPNEGTTAEPLADRLRREREAASDATAARAARARIRSYEQKHGLTSEQMWAAIRNGERAETAEMVDWFIETQVLRRLTGDQT